MFFAYRTTKRVNSCQFTLFVWCSTLVYVSADLDKPCCQNLVMTEYTVEKRACSYSHQLSHALCSCGAYPSTLMHGFSAVAWWWEQCLQTVFFDLNMVNQCILCVQSTYILCIMRGYINVLTVTMVCIPVTAYVVILLMEEMQILLCNLKFR